MKKIVVILSLILLLTAMAGCKAKVITNDIDDLEIENQLKESAEEDIVTDDDAPDNLGEPEPYVISDPEELQRFLDARDQKREDAQNGAQNSSNNLPDETPELNLPDTQPSEVE